MTTKTCKACGLEKSLDDFSIHPSLRDGRRSQCKSCNEQTRRARRSDPEKRRAELDRDNKARRENPEYRERHRKYENARRSADREAFRADRRDYYNRKLKSKRVVQTNAERREKARAACRRHWNANKQYYRTKTLNYLARKRGAVGTHTVAEFYEVLKAQSFRCFYCGCDIADCATEDHFVPLSRGGSNDIGNIRAACPWCNKSKGARSMPRNIPPVMEKQT